MGYLDNHTCNESIALQDAWCLCPDKFAATGVFENRPGDWAGADTSNANCRRVLNIHRKDHEQAELPDAVVIMMNPGGSKPHDDNVINEPVKTCPDKTQNQVMRLMNKFQWNFVRVINLSDLREAKSRRFYRLIRPDRDLSHSIFHETRRPELRQALTRRAGGPILLAWGVASRLRPLIDLAKDGLKEILGCANVDEVSMHPDLVGLRHPRTDWGFYHPLPWMQVRQQKWLCCAITQLNKRKTP